MKLKPTSPDEDRGQVGIGTLIVFIAMVLVAAIAAGVLINTAGFLQSQSEETGEQSSQQVTDRVTVTTTVGQVADADSDGANEITSIEMNVKKAPGAGDIDLSQATIQYLGPAGSTDLTEADSQTDGQSDFAVTAVKGSESVLSDSSDLLKITVGLANSPSDSALRLLEEGESATLEITTASGGSSTVTVTVPESLSSESAVTL
ncbi:archaellin/type IV pilin N-terminal domain-containing protein [Halobacteriales archaeon Cl-PHB]